MTNTTMPAPATTLRERMIEDMKVHRLCRTTQCNYLCDVERFAIGLGRPPDTATDEDLRRYQVEQSETGFGAPAMNTAVSALRFFYIRTLDRPALTRKLHPVKHPRGLPTVLSRDEVGRMLTGFDANADSKTLELLAALAPLITAYKTPGKAADAAGGGAAGGGGEPLAPGLYEIRYTPEGVFSGICARTFFVKGGTVPATGTGACI